MNIDRLISAIPGTSVAERAEMRANAGRWRDGGSPDQQAAADRLLTALDAQEQAERDGLASRVSNMEDSARVLEAFQVAPPTETDRKVMQALLDNPQSTSTELSRACGWGGQIWHTHFGTMCKRREVYLWPAEPFDKVDANFYSGILAELGPGSRWRMKPDVVAALAILGIKAKA